MVRHVVVDLRLTILPTATSPQGSFAMPEFIRVKDKSTKHEKSIPADSPLEGWEVLEDKPATHPDGTPLPDKHYVAPGSLSSQSTSGQKAEKKGGS